MKGISSFLDLFFFNMWMDSWVFRLETYLERLIVPLYYFYFFVKGQLTIYVSLFLGSFMFCWRIWLFFYQYHWLDYCDFIVNLKVRLYQFPNFFSFYSVLTIWDVLLPLIFFRVIFLMSTKWLAGFWLVLQWIRSSLEKLDILTILSFPIHEISIYSLFYSCVVVFLI